MDPQAIDFKNLNIFPPGEKIADELEARGQSVENLAQFLERPLAFVQQLIEGRQAIDAQLADQLQAFFEFDVSFWLKQEQRFRAQLAEYKARLAARLNSPA